MNSSFSALWRHKEVCAVRRKLLPLSAMMLMVCHSASGQEAPIKLEIKIEKAILDNESKTAYRDTKQSEIRRNSAVLLFY